MIPKRSFSSPSFTSRGLDFLNTPRIIFAIFVGMVVPFFQKFGTIGKFIGFFIFRVQRYFNQYFFGLREIETDISEILFEEVEIPIYKEPEFLASINLETPEVSFVEPGGREVALRSVEEQKSYLAAQKTGELKGILLLPGSGKYPLIYLRTPYGKEKLLFEGINYAERGFAVLIQDCRGRNDIFKSKAGGLSDERDQARNNGTEDHSGEKHESGSFLPLRTEKQDAECTLFWARNQEFFSGKIGAHGVSYVGLCAFSSLGTCQRDLVSGIFPINASSRLFPVLHGDGGWRWNLELIVRWMWLVIHRAPKDQQSFLEALRTMYNFWILKESPIFRQSCLVLPIQEMDTFLFGHPDPSSQLVFRDPSPSGAFWKDRDFLCDLEKISEMEEGGRDGSWIQSQGNNPKIHIYGGWFDFFLEQSIKDFEALCNQENEFLKNIYKSHFSRGELDVEGTLKYEFNYRLTVGSTSHWDVKKIGRNTTKQLLDFYDAVLKNKHSSASHCSSHPKVRTSEGSDGTSTTPLSKERSKEEANPSSELEEEFSLFLSRIKSRLPRVSLEVVSDPSRGSEWIFLDNWPPRFEKKVFFLFDGSKELRLSPKASPPEFVSPRTFTYEPLRPTPSLGGPSFAPQNCGSVEQSALELREDVLVYTSPRLSESLLLVGEITAEVYLECSSRHFDVVARLCRVDDNGVSWNVADGVTRVGDPGGLRGDSLEKNDSVVKVEVSMGYSALRLYPGESVRLHICAAAHPRWLRNLNSGDPIAEGIRVQPAHFYIYGGAVHSYLVENTQQWEPEELPTPRHLELHFSDLPLESEQIAEFASGYEK